MRGTKHGHVSWVFSLAAVRHLTAVTRGGGRCVQMSFPLR